MLDPKIAELQEKLSSVELERERLEAVCHPITHEQNGSLELVRSSDLDRVLSALPDCVWSAQIDPQGYFSYRFLSQAMEAISGYPREFFLSGKDCWHSLIHPDDLSDHLGLVGEMLAQKSPGLTHEHRIVHRDGSIRWVSHNVRLHYLADGTVMVDGVLSEITARKLAEDELRSSHAELDECVRVRTKDLAVSEHLFRQLAQSITEVFWLSSIDKKQMYYISPAYETVFGRSCASLYERPLSFIEAIHPDDVERINAAIPGQVRGEFDIEYRVVRPDGTQRWVRSRAFPVLDDDGEVYRVAGLVQDITERHQAAERLRENEELYRTLLDRHVDGVVLWVDGRMIYVNPAVCELTGRTEEDLLQADPIGLLLPDDRERARDRLAELMSGVPESIDEFQYAHPSGQMVCFELRSRIVPHRGQPAVLTFVRDVTEVRANADKSRFLAMIVRDSKDAIIGAQLDGRIVSWNPAAEQLFGFSAKEMRGQTMAALLPLDRQHELPQILETVRQGKPLRDFVTERLHRSGCRLHVSLTVSPLHDAGGAVVGMASIVRDITEQLRVEKARKQSEAMCESLVNTAPDLILIMDVDGTIRFINRVSPGTSVESILGRSTYEFLREDFHETVRACLKKVWDTGESVTCEVVGQGADGSWRWYESRHGALRQDGKTMGITVISTDITERKIEEQRLLAEDRMLRDLLEQRERERKLIAHEVHDGFMQDIVGAQLTLQSLLHAARVRQLPYLLQLENVDQSLRKAVNEGRRLIRELGPLVVEHVGLLAAIREHVEQEVVDGCLRVDVQENLDDSLYAPLLKGTVFRIVQESLTNIRHHSHATYVNIALREEEGRLHVEVKDDGVGFDPERVASDRFGLLGIRQRARLFGGHAEIDSAPGRGTIVRVNLPLILDGPLSDAEENE